MLIIVEGVDGSGKSTLVKHLLNDKMVDELVEVRRDCREIEDRYLCLSMDKKTFVMDRSFITEIVYRAEDGKETSKFDLFKLITGMYGRCKIIYCKTDGAYLDAMSRGEDNVTDEVRHDNISKIYDVLISTVKKYSRIPAMEYSWKKDNINDVFNFIKEDK